MAHRTDEPREEKVCMLRFQIQEHMVSIKERFSMSGELMQLLPLNLTLINPTVLLLLLRNLPYFLNSCVHFLVHVKF